MKGEIVADLFSVPADLAVLGVDDEDAQGFERGIAQVTALDAVDDGYRFVNVASENKGGTPVLQLFLDRPLLAVVADVVDRVRDRVHRPPDLYHRKEIRIVL